LDEKLDSYRTWSRPQKAGMVEIKVVGVLQTQVWIFYDAKGGDIIDFELMRLVPPSLPLE